MTDTITNSTSDINQIVNKYVDTSTMNMHNANMNADTETISFDDEDAPTMAFPVQPRTVTGSSNDVYDDYNPYDWNDDNSNQYATTTIPNVNTNNGNKKSKTSYAFSGGDSNLKGKPITKRPLFWIVFIAIILFITIPTVSNLTKPVRTTPVSETPVSTTAPSESNTDANKNDNNDNATTDNVSSEQAAETFDWSSLNGQKLSNAYQLMKYNGISRYDLKISLITNDGKYVLNDSNWTVLSAQYNGNGRLLINVKHDDSSNPVSKTIGDAGNTVKDKVNDFSPSNLGNTLNNTLGDLKNQLTNQQ